MSMFDNYDFLPSNYIPNNLTTSPPLEYKVIDDYIPKKIYNLKNDFIGYSWNYGYIFDFKLSVNDIIKVKDDSIIFTTAEEEPTDSLVGYKGQQCYNTVKNKSWTCSGHIQGIYVWVEDKYVTYDAHGTKEIEMVTDVSDSTITFEMYDKKWKLIYSITAEEVNEIICPISKDLYDKMKPDVYHCTLRVIGNNTERIKKQFEIVILNEGV